MHHCDLSAGGSCSLSPGLSAQDRLASGQGSRWVARYADDDTPYHSHEYFIDGIRCYADEARFGGIVIQVL